MKQVFWQCVEKVCSGKDGTARRNSAAIAIVRPPGHHAHRDRPSGFCFLNNVAVAAMVRFMNMLEFRTFFYVCNLATSLEKRKAEKRKAVSFR